MHKLRFAIASALTLAASAAFSAPITYEGILTPDDSGSGSVDAFGDVSEPSSSLSSYWELLLTGGVSYAIWVDREEGGLDPAFYLFDGTFSDDSVFGGDLDSVSGLFADDELDPAIPGPFGDPGLVFTPTSTGSYTVVVTNFLSTGTGGDGFFDFTLFVEEGTSLPRTSAVPLPAGLPLAAGGIGVLAMLRRRRRS